MLNIASQAGARLRLECHRAATELAIHARNLRHASRGSNQINHLSVGKRGHQTMSVGLLVSYHAAAARTGGFLTAERGFPSGWVSKTGNTPNT